MIDGRKNDIVNAAHELATEGVDAVLAFVGGDELLRCIDVVRKGGRVTYPNGIDPEPRKRKNARIKAYNAVTSPAKFAALNRAIVGSKLEVPIAKSFPLERAADAHRRVERGHLLGRIVIRP